MSFNTTRFNLNLEGLTVDQLSSWLRPGKYEGLFFEFRNINGSSPDYAYLAQKVAGMANTDGGIIFLGIPQENGDKGPAKYLPEDWVGLPENITAEDISNGIRAKLPEITLNKELSVKALSISQNKCVYIITVDESDSVIKAPGKISNNYPLRDNAGTNRPMSPLEFYEVKQKKKWPIIESFILLDEELSKENNYEQIFFRLIITNVGKTCAKYPLIIGTINAKLPFLRAEVPGQIEIANMPTMFMGAKRAIVSNEHKLQNNSFKFFYPKVRNNTYNFSSVNNDAQQIAIFIGIVAENYEHHDFHLIFSPEELIDKKKIALVSGE
jgi:hypothetical protein